MASAMGVPDFLETEPSPAGKPLPFGRYRYVHSCGRRGPWTDSRNAQIGYHSHARHCKG